MFAQIHAQLVVVGCVEGTDLADTLGSEAGAGAIGGAAVERHAEDRRIILTDVVDVLAEGRLHEGIDAGEVRQLAAHKSGDTAILDAGGGGQAVIETVLYMGFPGIGGQIFFLLQRFPALELGFVERRMVVEATTEHPGGVKALQTHEWLSPQ